MPHRARPTTDPSPWHGLREYLADAYSNAEMRTLLERSLLAQGGSLLPDERVPVQEYATTLCYLLQRHAGVPSPDFWCQLSQDRPLRQREVGKLRLMFLAGARDGAHATPRHTHPPGEPGWRTAPKLVLALLVSLAVSVATYCASAPKPKLRCNDGTPSPTCVQGGDPRGCCSGHDGVDKSEQPEPR